MVARSAPSEGLTAWLQLLRVSNLFTVPGDPLAGFCLASVAGNAAVSLFHFRPYMVLLISLLLYCAGLLQNDYFDLEEDRKDRPTRPIPSGRVSPIAVISVSSLLAALGVAIAYLVNVTTGIIATALLLVITIYNHSAKKILVFGPIFMGLCRGLSFLVGAAVLGWRGVLTPAIMISAIFLSVFIAVVTHIAARETDHYTSGAIRWGPGVTLLTWFSVLYVTVNQSVEWPMIFSLVMVALATFWTFHCGRLLVTNVPSGVVQQTVERFLRGLLLIQAAIVALAGFPVFIAVMLLLAAWPLSQQLAKRFYVS